MFAPLPDKPDHPRLEEEILEWWDVERVFDRLREQNRGREKWSFIDGPITANNAMGVHHAWGRTLKDLFQRYGSVITKQSRRLGMWMDWENTYYTFSDTNIEYIWRFLKECHARRWLYMGHRATQWCPRCGTSLSQHEQAGEDKYTELTHPSLFVRFPLRAREGESLAVWTTTPWTLPANVAAAVKPDADYVLVDGAWWLRALKPDAEGRAVRGEELVGLEYEGPFDHLPAQEGLVHRVIPWDEVETTEGTGIVHIPPGCGAEDFELSRVHDLAVLVPIGEAGRMS